ncbi:hypothetical protein [Bacteroides sp. 51]|uniref:hypothetical protein n=1 Tax=Bacteroides sp. 51 TaxID=2302938 RepID=UPI0013D773F8|nr:hypothetical protein [Bacteroides sp. 51]NDV80724.1 hypothetical protein [Bacteroides sp. 51]
MNTIEAKIDKCDYNDKWFFLNYCIDNYWLDEKLDTLYPNKCPILMCPDDFDFSCTLIVAEIENYSSFIRWKQIGIDKGSKWYDTEMRYDIEWFFDFQPLNFEFDDYKKMIQKFRKQYQLDKIEDKLNHASKP